MKLEMSPSHEDLDHKFESVSPSRFPIVEDKKVYFADFESPELVPGVIVHFVRNVFDRQKHTFQLSAPIGELNYIFSLSENSWASNFYLSFKTKEYEYAVLNLDKDSREELFRTIFEFVRTIAGSFPAMVDEILVAPADTPYTAEEIERCKQQILVDHPDEFTPEDITRDFQGTDIFDLYWKLYGESYVKFRTSKARARARLFQSMAKKELPEWEIRQEMGADFTLVRKQ